MAMASAHENTESDRERVRLTPAGLRLGTESVPLWSGSLHYFRQAPETWRPCLRALRELGFRLVDSCVPWNVHEQASGSYDFGSRNPRLDLATFVRTAGEEGLYVALRPGPSVNAELTYFGIPRRVIWNEECQARSPRGRPVVLPVPPLAFPVPSYASQTFLLEVERWYHELGQELVPLAWPLGPLVLLQVDHEACLYFRDGVYDQDYHSDAILAYRVFLAEKYGSSEALARAYDTSGLLLDQVEPPKAFFAASRSDLLPHLDWAESQEKTLSLALAQFRQALDAVGLAHVPTLHNLPRSHDLSPLNASELDVAVELLGQSYAYRCSATNLLEISRQTSALAERAKARGHVAYASDLAWGFPAYLPALSARDCEFSTLAALAFGARGFNVHMAVERDRWIGGLLDVRGKRQATAEFWEKLLGALEQLDFCALEREAPLKIVVPRSYWRLVRLLQVFGPVSVASLRSLGQSPLVACSEERFLEAPRNETTTGQRAAAAQGSDPALVETSVFLERLVDVLDKHSIAYHFVPGDLLEQALDTAAWTIVVCAGSLEPELLTLLERAVTSGKAVTLGPRKPLFDASLNPQRNELETLRAANREFQLAPLFLKANLADLQTAVLEMVGHAALRPLRLRGPGVRSALHVDQRRQPRALFLMNPRAEASHAEVELPDIVGARDAISGEMFRPRDGYFSIPMPAGVARLLELAASRHSEPPRGL